MLMKGETYGTFRIIVYEKKTWLVPTENEPRLILSV